MLNILHKRKGPSTEYHANERLLQSTVWKVSASQKDFCCWRLFPLLPTLYFHLWPWCWNYPSTQFPPCLSGSPFPKLQWKCFGYEFQDIFSDAIQWCLFSVYSLGSLRWSDCCYSTSLYSFSLILLIFFFSCAFSPLLGDCKLSQV